MSKRDYYLPACVVLWAAILGTKRAKAAAYAWFPIARAYEATRYHTTRIT